MGYYMDIIENAGTPRKLYVEVTIAVGANMAPFVVPSPAKGKFWQLFAIECSALPKTGMQDFSINDNNIGVYVVAGASDGAYGGIDIQSKYGPAGVVIADTDALSIAVSNSSGAVAIVGMSLFVQEFNK